MRTEAVVAHYKALLLYLECSTTITKCLSEGIRSPGRDMAPPFPPENEALHTVPQRSVAVEEESYA
jgi:hypothetical protein